MSKRVGALTLSKQKLEKDLIDWGYSVIHYTAPSLTLIEKLEVYLYVNTLADPNITDDVSLTVHTFCTILTDTRLITP